MKNIPKEVKIGGSKYKVKLINTFIEQSKNLLGLSCVPQKEIIISKVFNDNIRDIRKIHESFLHECLHMVEFEWNLDIDHPVLTQLSVGLYQVLVDNDLQFYKNTVIKSIKVGGFRYKVIYPYTFVDTGITVQAFNPDSDSLEVKVTDIDYTGSKCSVEYVKQVLFGCIMYLINLTYNGEHWGDIEDNDLYTYSRGIYQLIKDNKLNELFRNVKY